MLGKILGKKKDDFFMELPAQGDESAAAAPMAPAVRSEAVETPEATASGEPVATAPAPVVSAPAASDPESIIAAAVQAASQEAAQAQTAMVGGFATGYLLNPGNRSQRRRPGANMAAFKAMAQTVKI